MTKIIGHRGATGAALENTRASFRAAIAAGADMIEFDVRRTKDDKLVVIHDPTTERVANKKLTIRKKALGELQQSVKLNNGETLQSLDEALDLVGNTPVIVELKDTGSVDELLLVLGRHPKIHASVASFFAAELQRLRRARPDIPLYMLETFSPIDIVHTAHRIKATGIGLNFWLLNPLTYLLAKRYKLEIYAYVNAGNFGEFFMMHAARFVRLLYPNVHFCTRIPERFPRARAR